MEFIRVAYYRGGQPGPIVHPVKAETVEDAMAASDEAITELSQLDHPLIRLELLEPKHHLAVAEWDGSAWTRR